MFTFALQYCLMVGKTFAWKAVRDSALTAEFRRSFQRGIINNE